MACTGAITQGVWEFLLQRPSDIETWRHGGGWWWKYLWKVESRIIPNIHLWKVPSNVTHTLVNIYSTASLPLILSFLCFSPNSSISLHPPSSHPPQVVCSVLSSTVWINDWCSRPQVKVRKVHYWIISALLSLLPSAWPLLADVVEALEGTLFANALKTWTHMCVCVNPSCVCMFVFFVCKDVFFKCN